MADADVSCRDCAVAETTDGPRVRLCVQHAERDRLAADLAAARQEVENLCLDVSSAHSATDRVQDEIYTLQENLEKARRDRASIILATKAAGIEWRENEDGAETCRNARAEQAERRRDEVVKRWVEDAGERARALLARAPAR